MNCLGPYLTFALVYTFFGTVIVSDFPNGSRAFFIKFIVVIASTTFYGFGMAHSLYADRF